MGVFSDNNPQFSSSLFEAPKLPKGGYDGSGINPKNLFSEIKNIPNAIGNDDGTITIVQESIPTKKQEFVAFRNIFSGVGFATGVGYSFYKKTGFWKGFGIALIGSIALGGIGYGLDKLKQNK